MPIIIPEGLPATETLVNENIFIMNQVRATHQDIRPLKIAIVNLMPTKIVTETQLLRLITNFPLQIEVDFIHTETHKSKNTPEEHLINFYKTYDEIKNTKYDGMIITGAPVEQMDFEEVDYWNELKKIMEYTKHNVTSTMHICWGAQAGLYYHYGIPKHTLKEKMFGVFPNHITVKNSNLLRGFDDEFFVPQSRHTEVRKEDIEKVNDLTVLAESPDSGVYIVVSKDQRYVFITGHSEYDPLTLKTEYDRDVKAGLPIKVPKNYFVDDDPNKKPIQRWRCHANMLFTNWLNYYVYQETPYNINDIK